MSALKFVKGIHLLATKIRDIANRAKSIASTLCDQRKFSPYMHLKRKYSSVKSISCANGEKRIDCGADVFIIESVSRSYCHRKASPTQTNIQAQILLPA